MMSEIFGVIDTETNFSNQLISVGIVAVNATDYNIVDEYMDCLIHNTNPMRCIHMY